MGELDGAANRGNMTVNLSHAGNEIYGYGSFSEPEVGTYNYHIRGLVENEGINLFLTPDPIHSPTILLGTIQATAKLEDEGQIIGSWISSLGNSGRFTLKKVTKEHSPNKSIPNDEIFIVHGHDETVKDKITRFIEKLGLKATVLHEGVNQGMTIIEKFEEHSKKAGFAIAIFTPDDMAYSIREKSNPKPRTRQNVIFETGYFTALLGRSRICILYKGDVELPSDINGIVYIKIDSPESWEIALAKELIQAGYDVNLNKLITKL